MKTALWWSSVGKKYVGAVSGIALMLFIIVHLGGNLTMFAGDGGRLFNSYAHHLEALGPLLYVAEMGLLAIFVFHAIAGIAVQLDKWKARPKGYAVSATKGGPSRQTLASRSMIVTGLVLLVFLPLHVWMFKFNGGAPHAVVEMHGQPVKNLFSSVVTAFKNPVIAFGYVAVMGLLGLHLRHGFWSSLQSLGAMSPRLSPAIYAAGLLFAVAMAGGFLALPLWVFFSPALGAGGGP
jgi:succinate dehydrogenase / fumarate reductase, cytochrome b subunit